MKKLIVSALSTTLLLASSLSIADWTLDAKSSSLSFVSVKNTAIVEVHQFLALSGSIDEQGAASLTIDMKSVETLIPIRNERMGKMLFDSNSFPSALVTVKLDKATLDTLAAQTGTTLEVKGDLTIKNQSRAVRASLIVSATNDGGVTVSTTQPVLIYANEWGLLPGIDSLKTIAGLTSITPVIPVTFTLKFNQSASNQSDKHNAAGAMKQANKQIVL